MKRLRVTLLRGMAGHRRYQRRTVRSLGLHRIRDVVVCDDRPEVRGMLAAVAHLVLVEEVSE